MHHFDTAEASSTSVEGCGQTISTRSKQKQNFKNTKIEITKLFNLLIYIFIIQNQFLICSFFSARPTGRNARRGRHTRKQPARLVKLSKDNDNDAIRVSSANKLHFENLIASLSSFFLGWLCRCADGYKHTPESLESATNTLTLGFNPFNGGGGRIGGYKFTFKLDFDLFCMLNQLNV